MFIEMLLGTLRDPILWIASVLIAWPVERPFIRSLQLLATAGVLLGGFRMLVYVIVFKASLTVSDAFVILVCALGLSVGIGCAINILRRVAVNR